MELFQCKPHHIRLTRVACASQYRAAQHGDRANPAHREHCVGCSVGKAHASGKDSSVAVASVKAMTTPREGRKRRDMSSSATAATAKPDRTCEHCKKVFSPHRRDQRFCPGGVCNAAHHRAKNRRGPARPRQKSFHVVTPDPPVATGFGKPFVSDRPPPPVRSGGALCVRPTDEAAAREAVMAAIDASPDLFSGLSVAAVPVLTKHVAIAVARAARDAGRGDR